VAAVTAERSLLEALEAGCSAPIGAYARNHPAADAGGRHEPGRKPDAAGARRCGRGGCLAARRDLAAELLRSGASDLISGSEDRRTAGMMPSEH